MTNLIDHLDRQPVVDLGVGDRVDRQRHRASSGDLGERDDAQKELLPLHPPLLDLPKHVPADGAVHRAEHTVVLLLLHREVGAQDLLQRVLLRGLLERVVGRVLVDRLDERRLPGQLLNLLVGLRDAGSAQGRYLLSLRAGALALGDVRAHAALTARLVPCVETRRAEPGGSRTTCVSADAWKARVPAGAERRSGAMLPGAEVRSGATFRGAPPAIGRGLRWLAAATAATSRTVAARLSCSSSNARRDMEIPITARKRPRASRTGAATQQKSSSNSSRSTAYPPP